jgi:hypothetical protein
MKSFQSIEPRLLERAVETESRFWEVLNDEAKNNFIKSLSLSKVFRTRVLETISKASGKYVSEFIKNFGFEGELGEIIRHKVIEDKNDKEPRLVGRFSEGQILSLLSRLSDPNLDNFEKQLKTRSDDIFDLLELWEKIPLHIFEKLNFDKDPVLADIVFKIGERCDKNFGRQVMVLIFKFITHHNLDISRVSIRSGLKITIKDYIFCSNFFDLVREAVKR